MNRHEEKTLTSKTWDREKKALVEKDAEAPTEVKVSHATNISYTGLVGSKVKNWKSAYKCNSYHGTGCILSMI